MYDPYTMDRIRFEQSKRERRVGAPRPSRTRALASRRITWAELAGRRAEPSTD
jgi:hypothetical protein